LDSLRGCVHFRRGGGAGRALWGQRMAFRALRSSIRPKAGSATPGTRGCRQPRSKSGHSDPTGKGATVSRTPATRRSPPWPEQTGPYTSGAGPLLQHPKGRKGEPWARPKGARRLGDRGRLNSGGGPGRAGNTPIGRRAQWKGRESSRRAGAQFKKRKRGKPRPKVGAHPMAFAISPRAHTRDAGIGSRWRTGFCVPPRTENTRPSNPVHIAGAARLGIQSLFAAFVVPRGGGFTLGGGEPRRRHANH